MDGQPDESLDPQRSVDELERTLRELRDGIHEVALGHEELVEATNTSTAILMLCIPVFTIVGFVVAWTIARTLEPDLPLWPTVVGPVIQLGFCGLVVLRSKPHLWRENIATLRSNLLVIAISTILAVGFFLLGLAVPS